MYKILLALTLLFATQLSAQDIRLVLPVGHTDRVNCAQFSPDGKKIVTASQDKTAKIWDAETGKLLLDLKGHSRNVKFAQFSPDGKKIVTASSDKSAKVWDAESGELLLDLNEHEYWDVKTAIFSPDGKKIITTLSCKIKIWDAETGILILEINQVREDYYMWVFCSAQFSSDGIKIFTVAVCGMQSQTSRIQTWDAETGELLSNFKTANILDFPQFSQDGKTILLSEYSRLKICNMESGGGIIHELKRTAQKKIFNEYIEVAQFSPDEKKIFISSHDSRSRHKAQLLDLETGNELFEFKEQIKKVVFAQFSPDGKKIVIATCDSIARVWDAVSGKLLLVLKGQSKTLSLSHYNSDVNKLLSAFNNRSMNLWDIDRGKLLLNITELIKPPYEAQLSPDGKKILTAIFDTAKVWNTESGKLLWNLKGYSNIQNDGRFTPDSKKMITIIQDTIKIWDIETGKLLWNLKHEKNIISAQFSPDGKCLVSASSGSKKIKVWNVNKGKKLINIKHVNAKEYAQFSPDGKKVFAPNDFYSSDDEIVRIWDTKKGKLLRVLKSNDYYGADKFSGISPDLKKMITIDPYLDTTKVWDVESGKLLYVLGHNSGENWFIQFSADGKRILKDNMNGDLNIWDAETFKFINAIKIKGGIIIGFNWKKNQVITNLNSKFSLWDINTGNELISWVFIDSADYLILHPNGFFDGTPAAIAQLYFVKGSEIIPLETYYKQFYRPNLWERVMKGEKIE